jgi:hypothetical protein
LEITDSVPSNLAADLTHAAAEIDAGTYTGYTVTASTTDPLTIFNNGYDFYFTITNNTLGTGSPYFGFDFTQLNDTTDTLSVSAVAAVPEPASLRIAAIGGTTASPASDATLETIRRGNGVTGSIYRHSAVSVGPAVSSLSSKRRQ